MKSPMIMMCLAGGLTMAPLLKAEPPIVVTIPGVTVSTGVWTTVPEDYDGDYYIHENHYYYGGKHEVGDFDWENHHYQDRYYHDGKWIYGGKLEHHARKHMEHEKREHEKHEKHEHKKDHK